MITPIPFTTLTGTPPEVTVTFNPIILPEKKDIGFEDRRIAAARILHDIEIELFTKVGSMEFDSQLVDSVADTLLELEMVTSGDGVCSCTCRVCSMAEHGH